MNNRVFRNAAQETACEITEGVGAIYFMDQLEQNTGEPSHKRTGRYAYQEGIQGADAGTMRW